MTNHDTSIKTKHSRKRVRGKISNHNTPFSSKKRIITSSSSLTSSSLALITIIILITVAMYDNPDAFVQSFNILPSSSFINGITNRVLRDIICKQRSGSFCHPSSRLSSSSLRNNMNMNNHYFDDDIGNTMRDDEEYKRGKKLAVEFYEQLRLRQVEEEEAQKVPLNKILDDDDDDDFENDLSTKSTKSAGLFTGEGTRVSISYPDDVVTPSSSSSSNSQSSSSSSDMLLPDFNPQELGAQILEEVFDFLYDAFSKDDDEKEQQQQVEKSKQEDNDPFMVSTVSGWMESKLYYYAGVAEEEVSGLVRRTEVANAALATVVALLVMMSLASDGSLLSFGDHNGNGGGTNANHPSLMNMPSSSSKFNYKDVDDWWKEALDFVATNDLIEVAKDWVPESVQQYY